MGKEENSGATWGQVASSAISTAANIGAGSVSSKAEYHRRKKLMEIAYQRDLEMMESQRFYNSPAQQRARFEAAGLNAALMYGTGSSSAGNMESYPKAPVVPPQEMMSVYGNIGSQFMDMLSTIRLKDSQTNLNASKVEESGVKQDLMKAQESLVKANPYLNTQYVTAMVRNMMAVASTKQAEYHATWTDDLKSVVDPTAGQKKVMLEIENLTAKWKLSEMDQKLRAEVLQSKQFQNDLQKIQVDWMKSGDITPQHIYQGILLLLGKMM